MNSVSSKQSERGQLFVIAAPSGAGKTTLVHRIVAANPQLRFSISYTTREPRKTEVHEKDYFFVSPEAFKAMIEAGDFLEHATVFDHQYGTSRKQVDSLLNQGFNVLLEIDWQGAQQVRNHMSECRSVFILPPSVKELRKRLSGRGTDSEAVIDRRFSDALSDLSHWHEFDYGVINDDLSQAEAELTAIVQGQGEDFLLSQPALRARITAILEDASQ